MIESVIPELAGDSMGDLVGPLATAPTSPEKKLLLALFADAVAQAERDELDARLWLALPGDADEYGSFAFVVGELGFDLSDIQRRILARWRSKGSGRSLKPVRFHRPGAPPQVVLRRPRRRA